MSPLICSPADPLPSSPAQDALDLLFPCGSTEEASSSPARGPLTEAELALFDPFSKKGKELGQSEGGWAKVLRDRPVGPPAGLRWLCTPEIGTLCGQAAA